MSVQRGFLALLFFFALSRATETEPRLECSMLELEECAFAVSDSGYRCVLEKKVGSDHKECQMSTVKAGSGVLAGYVENDDCTQDCGADKSMIGFDSEAIHSPRFTEKLCSSKCRDVCFNLVDLYSSIIAGEGMTLSEFCSERRRAVLISSRRSMAHSPSQVKAALSPSHSRWSHPLSPSSAPSPSPV